MWFKIQNKTVPWVFFFMYIEVPGRALVYAIGSENSATDDSGPAVQAKYPAPMLLNSRAIGVTLGGV
jgi:hypothetical protein